MKRTNRIDIAAAICLVALAGPTLAQEAVIQEAGVQEAGNQQPVGPQQLASGVVYEDTNQNQQLDDTDRRMPGVKVSNGRDIVVTDESGGYEIRVSDDTIVFVIKPRGYRTPLSDHKLPVFYYIHKPKGSPQSQYAGVAPTGPLPKSIDFPLYKQDEPDQFRAIMFADPQPRNQQEIDYIAHDVVEELIGREASFGVTLGDIMFDDLNLFPSQARTIALIGIPWYNVIGNHDINFDASNDRDSDETFERNFGPSYYSFDYGPVHFIALDDVQWYIPEGRNRGKYRGGLGPRQMEFVKNDLARVPEEQLVVLMMHIPLVDVHDRHELFRLIEQRPFCMSISGHTHHHEHVYLKQDDGWRGPKPHHHVINVTVSGSWWSGKPDERGIPHTMMKDGAPNGYSIISFDGARYKLDFKAAAKPAGYQMNVHAPEVVSRQELGATTIYANIFNGSEHTKVRMRVDGATKWQEMERSLEVDPAFKALIEEEAQAGDLPWRKLPSARLSPHLWKAPLPESLPAGTHLIRIQGKNDNGQVFRGKRVIRVID